MLQKKKRTFCEANAFIVSLFLTLVILVNLFRILRWVAEENEKEAIKRPITGIILDMSSK